MASEMQASSNKRSISARRAATLVELLIAIPIVVIVGIIVTSLFLNYINMFVANNDLVIATQRADSVFRLLEEPVLHAGLGLDSSNAENYRKNWKSEGSYTTSEPTLPFPARWEGAVVPAYAGKTAEMDAVVLFGPKGDGYYESIGIVYAIPTGLKVSDDVRNIGNSNREFEISFIPLGYELSDKIPVLDISADLRSWFTMPGTMNTAVPMLAKEIVPGTGTEIKLKMEILGKIPPSFVIPMHQELFRLKAVKAYVEDDRFELMDITGADANYGSGATRVTTIDGVRGARFKLSEDRKYIEVRLLVMGDSHEAAHAQERWSYLQGRWDEVKPEDSGTFFEEFVIKWRVRDLSERS